MSIAIYYLTWVIGPARKAAREKGYALGLHGSLNRDMDIIAVPWTEDAAPAEELVAAITAAVGAGTYNTGPITPTQKPHGRWAWTILLGGGAYIDLSVVPVLRKEPPPGAAG